MMNVINFYCNDLNFTVMEIDAIDAVRYLFGVSLEEFEMKANYDNYLQLYHFLRNSLLLV